MAPLRCAAKFDLFLSLDCARAEGVGRKAKARDQILPSGNLDFRKHEEDVQRREQRQNNNQGSAVARSVTK